MNTVMARPTKEGEMSIIPSVSVPEGRVGAWRVERFEIPANSFHNFRLAMEGRHAKPGIYTRLIHDKRGLLMSDTPAERRDHIRFALKAHGHCLINGLGLGMCLGAILLKPEVSHVTVIEIDADVISLVGPHYDDPRVEIVCADAYEYRPLKGVRYGAVWHDIWGAVSTDDLADMTRLKRRYGRRAEWQGCWFEEQLRYRHRQERAQERRWAPFARAFG